MAVRVDQQTISAHAGIKLTPGCTFRGLPFAGAGEQSIVPFVINTYQPGMHNTLRHGLSPSVTVTSVHLNITASPLTRATYARVVDEPPASLPRFAAEASSLRAGTPAKAAKRPVVASSNDAAAALQLRPYRRAKGVDGTHWRGAGVTGHRMLPLHGAVRTIGVDTGITSLYRAADALPPGADGRRRFDFYAISGRQYKHLRDSEAANARLVALDAPIATALSLLADAPSGSVTVEGNLAYVAAVSTVGVTVVRHRLQKKYLRLAHARELKVRIALARLLGDMRRGRLVQRTRNMRVRRWLRPHTLASAPAGSCLPLLPPTLPRTTRRRSCFTATPSSRRRACPPWRCTAHSSPLLARRTCCAVRKRARCGRAARRRGRARAPTPPPLLLPAPFPAAHEANSTSNCNTHVRRMREVVDPRRPAGMSRRVAEEAAQKAARRDARARAGGGAAPPAPAARRGLVSGHGLRYCDGCGAVKSRDDNAAICIHDVGVYEYNHGVRPLAFVTIDQLPAPERAARRQEYDDAAHHRHVLR